VRKQADKRFFLKRRRNVRPLFLLVQYTNHTLRYTHITENPISESNQ